jgi:23S rRNA G2069 N7-methylase RlmK/C1962 C5-methylase RlmI
MQRYACNVTPLATAPDRRTREFDLVVLDPDTFGTGIVGTGIEGTVDRYVAMTRATQQLVILTST